MNNEPLQRDTEFLAETLIALSLKVSRAQAEAAHERHLKEEAKQDLARAEASNRSFSKQVDELLTQNKKERDELNRLIELRDGKIVSQKKQISDLEDENNKQLKDYEQISEECLRYANKITAMRKVLSKWRLLRQMNLDLKKIRK